MNKKFKLNCVPCGGCCITPSDQKNLVFQNDSELTEIDVDVTAIESLKIENCENLITIDCLYNELKEFIIINCPNVTSINCYNNHLTELNISECKNLIFLDCSYNNLSKESINRILFDLVHFQNKDGILKIDNQENLEIPNESLEYVSVLKHSGWKVIYGRTEKNLYDN